MGVVKAKKRSNGPVDSRAAVFVKFEQVTDNLLDLIVDAQLIRLRSFGHGCTPNLVRLSGSGAWAPGA